MDIAFKPWHTLADERAQTSLFEGDHLRRVLAYSVGGRLDRDLIDINGIQ